ncbi:conserved hypothetical protein [Candidatus Liberibacter solanacearum]
MSAHHNARGLMCVKDMELLVGDDGEVKTVLPTHYKHSQTGAILPVENPYFWVEN